MSEIVEFSHDLAKVKMDLYDFEGRFKREEMCSRYSTNDTMNTYLLKLTKEQKGELKKALKKNGLLDKYKNFNFDV